MRLDAQTGEKKSREKVSRGIQNRPEMRSAQNSLSSSWITWKISSIVPAAKSL